MKGLSGSLYGPALLLELHSGLPIDPTRFGPQSVGTQNAAQLRSTHRMTATLRLVTAMLTLVAKSADADKEPTLVREEIL
jgi:hypothetical protein